MFMLRYAMRSATAEPDDRQALYGAALEMSAWAESHGALAVTVSQHHGSDDGYLPSPIPMAAAIAAKTTSIPISVAALLLNCYEPVKVAEDIAVVDLISRGRVSYVIGIGYRQEEFDMFRIDRRHRGRLVEERIGIVRSLLAGESVEIEGQTVAITPLPFSPGGPMLAYGGGTEAAARRAGRLGMMFIAESFDSSLEAAYLEEADKSGHVPLGCMFPTPDVPLTLFVADDPDRAWTEIGEYMLRDALSYGRWNAHRTGTASISFAQTVEELRAEHGSYQVVRPEEAKAMVAQGKPLALQPLVGGLPPDLAWPYLEAAAAAAGSS